MRNRIFVSYSHKNQKWLATIKMHLAPMIRSGEITLWDDSMIQPGDKWRREIAHVLAEAGVAILLVTPEFLESEFIANNELPPLLDAAEKHGLRILWLSVSASLWEETNLRNYQAVNDPENPLDSLSPADLSKEMVRVARRIKEAANQNAQTTGHESTQGGSADLTGLKVVQIYRRNIAADEQIRVFLERELTRRGCGVFSDQQLRVGTGWSREIENHLKAADAVVALLSPRSVESEMLQYEIQLAHEFRELQQGRPRILPVRIGFEAGLPDEIASVLAPIHYFLWDGPDAGPRLLREILEALQRPPEAPVNELPPVGGCESLDSKYYVIRHTDHLLNAALRRRDSIILIKGARQMGKTSLLARGIHYISSEANRNPALDQVQVVRTDFQKLNSTQLQTIDSLYMSLARWISDQLKIDVQMDRVWSSFRSPNLNLEAFLMDVVLPRTTSGLLWAMDEVDRLFPYNYANDFFGLIRSWHNDRAFQSGTGWNRLTIAIAYATEAHLFITDLNQSPFNVGTRLELADFTRDQVMDLNRRHDNPLKSENEIDDFVALFGGHPFLVRRALREMKERSLSFGQLDKQAALEEGPFGDHLRRILVLLARDEALRESLRKMVAENAALPLDAFFRLRAAGLVLGQSASEAVFRCALYQRYLARNLLVPARARAQSADPSPLRTGADT